MKSKAIVAGAAIAGLMSGAFAATSHAAVSEGKNSCKGKGGCKGSDNGCKGKNSCKGKGGCATDGSKPAPSPTP